MWAAREGNTAAVQVLLEQGAEVNASDNYGGTALQLDNIIKHKININAQDKQGWTALMRLETKLPGYRQFAEKTNLR
ncbi:MAG: ankyrin repeat domain-containing protein [Prochloron sp. SP5CPC1]|nr:ankyrin repeat domain-containing protein [Candidatus Paraprochloron terpiosi SP5CPC1]